MHSTLLEKQGLANKVFGADYNFRTETSEAGVDQDIQKALKELEISPKVLYSGFQCHGKNVAYSDGQTGDQTKLGRQFKETDGLITDKEDIALMVKFADCTPIVMFDPKKKILSAVHSGWRGTVQRISHEAIDQMVNDFGSNLEDILVYVGPSIDIDNYEVGPEVYEAFEGFSERDSFFQEHGEKYQLSMTGANVSILKEAGIKEENIEVSEESTWNSDALHSSRQEGKDYQLNSMIVMMES